MTGRQVLTEAQDSGEIIARVAALDIGKAELTRCVRVPDEDHPGKRLQEVAAFIVTTTLDMPGLPSDLTGGASAAHLLHERPAAISTLWPVLTVLRGRGAGGGGWRSG